MHDLRYANFYYISERKNLKILSFVFACILAFPCINLVMHKELVTPNLFKTDIATNKGKGNSESLRETPEHGKKKTR